MRGPESFGAERSVGTRATAKTMAIGAHNLRIMPEVR